MRGAPRKLKHLRWLILRFGGEGPSYGASGAARTAAIPQGLSHQELTVNSSQTPDGRHFRKLNHRARRPEFGFRGLCDRELVTQKSGSCATHWKLLLREATIRLRLADGYSARKATVGSTSQARHAGR